MANNKTNNDTVAATAIPIQITGAGETIEGHAGEVTVAALSVTNKDPDDCDYYVEVTAGAMPAAWVDGAGEGNAVTVAPYASQLLSIAFRPPSGAAEGDYAGRLKVYCSGELINGAGYPVTFRVAGSGTAAALDIPEPIEPPLVESSPYKPPRRRPVAKAEPVVDEVVTPLPAAATVAQPQAAAMPTPASVVAPPTEQKAPIREPGAARIATERLEDNVALRQAPPQAPRPAAPLQETRIASSSPPEPSPSAARATPTPPKRSASVVQAVTPEPPPKLVAEPVAEEELVPDLRPDDVYEGPAPYRVVDYDAGEDAHASASHPDTPTIDEKQSEEDEVIDPEEGLTIRLRPGETKVMVFRQHNDQTTGARGYLVEEDRSQSDMVLERGWSESVKGRVNLGAGISSFVSLRLKPPITARPGLYDFLVRVGPESSPQTRRYRLEVLATPAVKVTTKLASASAGPLSRAAQFKMTVESAGNSQTGFRIAAKAPAVADGADQPIRDDIYETPPWSYQFEYEAGNLKSPGANKPPAPEEVNLRVVRTGIWWLGFRTTHHVRVAAVPVTDSSNGGKRENTVDLNATIWRLWPFPYRTVLPILLICFLAFSGRDDNLRVEGVQPSPIDNVYYISGDQATLQWDGRPYPWLRIYGMRDSSGNPTSESVFGQHNELVDHVTVSEGSGKYYVAQQYHLSKDDSDQVNVVYAPGASSENLTFKYNFPNEPTTNLKPISSGSETTYTVRIPASQPTVAIKVYNKDNGRTVEVFATNLPDHFAVRNFQKSGSSYHVELTSGSYQEFFLDRTAQPQSGSSSDELTLMTTDKGNQIVHLKLVTIP